MDSDSDKEKVKKYYDQEAGDYKKIYREECAEYPANTIRIDFVVERLKQNNVRTILDAGCGICTPMIRLLSEGFKVKGFDFSEEMVREGKKELEKAGFAPDLICQGDIEDNSAFPDEKFDAILALGIFPHLSDEAKALSNMGRRLKKGGLVFIQFRNELFAAFTLNKYSLDFFLNRVIDLGSLPDNIAEEVISFYAERLKVDKPAQEIRGKISFLDIQATFRNPLTIEDEIFKPNGFSISKIHFYHYHALPPIFENKYPDLFQELSLKLEDPNHWKGYLMASAYVVEASKND